MEHMIEENLPPPNILKQFIGADLIISLMNGVNSCSLATLKIMEQVMGRKSYWVKEQQGRKQQNYLLCFKILCKVMSSH